VDIVFGIVLIRSNNTSCVVPGYSERCFTLLIVMFTTFHDRINFTLTMMMMMMIIIIVTIIITESEIIAAQDQALQIKYHATKNY
jgi:competence protein ComGC